jgi:AraC-like DNA-binding protein
MSNDVVTVTPRGFFAPNLFVVATAKVISRPCQRPTVTLLLSTNDTPFQLQLPGLASVSAKAAIVAPNQERRLHADGCDLLSINIEPGHRYYLPMRQRLRFSRLSILDDRYFHGVREESRFVYEGSSNASETISAIDAVLGAAEGKVDGGAVSDARIVEVLERVHATLPDKLPLAVLAKSVKLSPGRLSHLFSDTVGASLQAYISWHRYRLALKKLSHSDTLTSLASECGFADAAHMSRTFVGFFGLPPITTLRSGFVQDLALMR